MRGVVERNRCAHGFVVLTTADAIERTSLLWVEPDLPEVAAAVVSRLAPGLRLSTASEREIVGPWSAAYPVLESDAREAIRRAWGASQFCASRVVRQGGVDVWLVLGAAHDDAARFETLILSERRERLGLLLSAMTAPVRRLIEKQPPRNLSADERDVLAKLADGMRPAEIAAARGSSLATVRNQISRARRRLGAESDAGAVSAALRRGIIA